MTALVVAVVYLITRKPSVIDQVVITTYPSGAEIKLNSKAYGNSPVKLEQVKVGTYTLTISKEGYETITEQVDIAETPQLDYRLKQIPPADAAGLSTEERMKRYREQAAMALTNGHYIFPRDGSAIYYADLILEEDAVNPFALETKETIRKRLLQAAQAAAARGDFGEAKETINLLLDYYQRDPEILATANRLEAQLSTRRGEARDWTRKAEEALHAGILFEPQRTSANYYVKQALALEPQNPSAVGVRNQIKEQVIKLADQALSRSDAEAALRLLQQAAKYLDDKQIRAKINDIQARKNVEVAKAGDADSRRIQGLAKHSNGDFFGAISDLEVAMTNGKGTPDVIFALGHSHFQLGHWAEAADYLSRVANSGSQQGISAIALLGEIAVKRGDFDTALERFKQARQLGGSNLYLPPKLDDMIERIEKRQQEKATAPTPVSIEVKHSHGALRGSCSGTLTIDSAGVRYNGEHPLAANLVGVTAVVRKNELVIGFQGKSVKFEVSTTQAERFREALAKYQSAAQK